MVSRVRTTPSAWMFAAASLVCATFTTASCVPSLNDNPAREVRRDVPAAFTEDDSATSIAAQTWNSFFSDDDLRSLIELAISNNQELNVRLQEIVVARSEVAARQGEVAPRVQAGTRVGVDKVGRETSQGRADEANGVPGHLGSFAFGLTGSWEIDIWKKLRNAASAADLQYRATIEARNFVVTQARWRSPKCSFSPLVQTTWKCC
jgi:multidrug efflux system outer membrane protein